MVRIVDNQSVRVEENRAGFIKRHSVFGLIEGVLVGVPLKPHLIHTYIVVILMPSSNPCSAAMARRQPVTVRSWKQAMSTRIDARV